MKITSPAFAAKLPVPTQYTCKGQNVSPPLEFIDVPKEARSLVLIMDDLDSPNHRIHWLVYNIPGDCSHFDEGEHDASALEGISHMGLQGYEGPCPKDFRGIHHFSFRLYALDSILEIPGPADATMVLSQMDQHVLASAELVGVVEGE